MNPLERYEYIAPTMGTLLKIVLYASSEHEAQDAIDDGLTEIERLMPILSNYDPESEISQLTTTAMEPVLLSRDLSQVLGHAKRWHLLSDGAFDVTLGPLTQVWSLARRDQKKPDPESLDAARSRCGWEHVRWIEQESSPKGTMAVQLLMDAMRIDVSGLATGYIIDRAFEAIRRRGIESLLIDIGGDIRLGLAPPLSHGWKVDIAGLGKESPLLSQRLLEHCAVTASGDLHQFVEIDGIRYSHLIDPRTGQPLRRRQSVIAIAPQAVDADAGATALSVLGMSGTTTRFDNMPLKEAILLESDLHSGGLSEVRYRRWVQEAE